MRSLNPRLILFGFITLALLSIAIGVFLSLSTLRIPRTADSSIPSVRYGQGEVVVGGQTLAVAIAEDALAWQQGLSYRPSWGDIGGMLFVFPQPDIKQFWMYEMRFPIDIIWVSGERIVGWEANAPIPGAEVLPEDLPRYASPEAVDRVLEVPAGSVAAWGLRVGDIVLVK